MFEHKEMVWEYAGRERDALIKHTWKKINLQHRNYGSFHNALITKGANLLINEEEYVAGWIQSEPAGDHYHALLVEHNDK